MNTIKELYKFLYHISNSVGDTITEYHWREACELMKFIEDENLLSQEDIDVINTSIMGNIKTEILLNREKGIVIDSDEIPYDINKCIYTFKNGVKSDMEVLFTCFVENVCNSQEFDLCTNNNSENWNLIELEKCFNKYYPDVIDYLINNNIKEIRYNE